MAAEEDNFEEPILDLERRIEALSGVGDDSSTQRQREQLQQQLESLRTNIFSKLSPWQKTLVARHPKRPHTLNYVAHLVGQSVNRVLHPVALLTPHDSLEGIGFIAFQQSHQ